MLPIFWSHKNSLLLKPITEQIFEQLYDVGIRQFYFIVGREKRAMEDHFTPDRDFVRRLRARDKTIQASYLDDFYRKLDSSTITWVNQPVPKGFGHAILQVEQLVGEEPFLVHAGDTYIMSKRDIIHDLMQTHEKIRDAAATITVKKFPDPKNYGVAVIFKRNSSLYVERVIEKPKRPPSKFAIMPIYIFEHQIFSALKRIRPSRGKELELTDGIQRLILDKYKVHAMNLRNTDLRLDIGTPETYWEALKSSYHYASQTLH